MRKSWKRSVNDRFVGCIVEAFQVGNVQRAHGLDRHTQRFIRAIVPSQGLARGPQDPENLRTIKPLPFTMLAEAHSVHCLG
jgi:hypothetical protein